MECPQSFRILLVPSYPVVFLVLRDSIMLITSDSVTGIVYMCSMFSRFSLFSNLEALPISLCSIVQFVVVLI
jgi:hypothetical protein